MIIPKSVQFNKPIKLIGGGLSMGLIYPMGYLGVGRAIKSIRPIISPKFRETVELIK